MTGSILQLVAYGVENIFLNHKPQITYFKIVYKRHTNFSQEEIRQNFLQQPDFGKRVTCSVSKNGDLMEKTYLCVTLPEIPKSYSTDNTINQDENFDHLVKCAWVRKVGYQLINNIEFELNGRLISKHYGEYMCLKNEMFGSTDENFNKLIGDIDSMTSYTNGKDPYKLYIPLQFWFCKSSCNALPLLSLSYSDIKVNVEFNDWNKLIKFTPTHLLECDISYGIPAEFEKYEIIKQTINGLTAYGEFQSYDPVSHYVYYRLLGSNNFQTIPDGTTNMTPYKITGLSSTAYTYPIRKINKNLFINPKSNSNLTTFLAKGFNLSDTYLLVNYIFLDDSERNKFAKTKHEYLIDQVYYNDNSEITGPSEQIKLSIDNPCKALYWVLQQKYIYDSMDYLNYTNTSQLKLKSDTTYKNTNIGDSVGSSLIKKTSILLNQRERISLRTADYFSNCQIYQNCKSLPPKGTNAYFFAIYPDAVNQSGSCNMSKIEQIELKFTTDPILSANNLGIFRSYAECINILRISVGVGGVLFDR